MKGVFLDIETTGLDAAIHRPIDIALKILDLSTGAFIAGYQSLINCGVEAWEKSDPYSLQINGYRWEQIQEGSKPEEVSRSIVALLSEERIIRERAFFICQNPSFDRAFFNTLIPVYLQEERGWPYHWLDLASMYWAIHIRQLRAEGKELGETVNISKDEIAKAYGIPAEGRPHSAREGVEHLIQCYLAVVGFTKLRRAP